MDEVKIPEAVGSTEVEKYAKRERDTFPVIELFGPTIQGEGSMIGVKTMFIRMGGCDYRCKKCDSLHAVIPDAVHANAKWRTQEDIFEDLLIAKHNGTDWVTISGGNPAMWDLTKLVLYCKEAGIHVAVETQGTIWRDWLAEVDVLTVSPKGPGMGEKFNPAVFRAFCGRIQESYQRLAGRLSVCMKVVVFDQQDFEFAVGIDDILNENIRFWPKCDRYLSLGNSTPPLLKPDMSLDENPMHAMEQAERSRIPMGGLPQALLEDYAVLLEDYLKDWRLKHWKFLPQLHVLIWGNKTAV